MFAPFEIPVAPCRNVEIPLHLVSLQTAIDSTRVPPIPPSQLGRFPKLLLLADHLPQHMPHVSVLLQLRLHLTRLLQQMQSSFGIHPLPPTGGISVQQVASENAIAAGVLNVDVQIGAGHGHHQIKVDLKVVRHAFFHTEKVGFMPAIPSTEFGERKQQREKEEEQRGVATYGAAAGVGGFGFCWRSSAQVVFEMRSLMDEHEGKRRRKDALRVS